jgi:hypothetical protein
VYLFELQHAGLVGIAGGAHLLGLFLGHHHLCVEQLTRAPFVRHLLLQGAQHVVGTHLGPFGVSQSLVALEARGSEVGLG